MLEQGLRPAMRAVLSRRLAIHASRPHTRIVNINTSRASHRPSHCRPFGTSVPYQFHATPSTAIDVTEGADSSTPKQSEPQSTPTQPTPLSETEYNERSDAYLETLLERLEEKQEEKGDLDVEYSQGVLTISAPPVGEYVLNKQPSNKQIWLSSPMSGPKRFDWCVMGEGLDQKEGAGVGDWVYLRDGTILTDLLRKELGIDVGAQDGL